VNTLRLYLLLLLVISNIAHSKIEIQAAVEDLLTTADNYLKQDQLRTPANANAYDRYKAVLLLDKNNARAQAGLDAIVRRYLELARVTAKRGRDNTQFELDKTALSNRDRVMVAQLQSLGLRVKDTREYVLIHARSDAEGRWIYQQMRNASKGYRLRGDIRRSKTPKVILQPPLD